MEFGETTEPIRTASHRPVQGTQVKTAQYQLRFKTRRDPMLRPAGPPVTDALLFSRNKELVLEDPVLKNCIVEKDCYGDFWRVELMGSGAMMNER